jgi:L-threonylcarbamoyladenylate synthase
VLLRPGHISAAAIARVIGREPRAPDAAAPRASGTLEAHYAPATPVALVAPDQLAHTMQALADAGRQVALIRHGVEFPPAAAQRQLPAQPDGYAHDLYAALRTMDAAGADIILVEAPPAGDAWQGVNDRLRRAAHDSQGVLERLLGPSA